MLLGVFALHVVTRIIDNIMVKGSGFRVRIRVSVSVFQKFM